MDDLVLIPTTDAPRTLRQRIADFALNETNLPDSVFAEALITQFIATTPLAPALNGEPVFVLRAADKLAPFIVKKWADEAESHLCPKAKYDGADLIAVQMIAWQLANPALTKYPD